MIGLGYPAVCPGQVYVLILRICPSLHLASGVDIEAARKEEERIMLRDARQWLNSGQINDVRHAKSGGTALHVAAAKGYTEVLK